MGIKKIKRIDITYLLIYVILLIFCIVCLVPFLLVISVSLSDEASIVAEGYRLWPVKFSLDAYNILFNNISDILNSYIVTIVVTVVGTCLSVLFTLLLAYPLSSRSFRYRNIVSFFVFFTMLFNGGIVPWYILCKRYLKLYDNIFALIVPYILSAWLVFLLRNFLATIPASIEESAKIDGAGQFRILFGIITPLSLPGIATIALFTTLTYWNDWWLGLMLIDRNDLCPLQLYLMKIMSNIQFFEQNRAGGFNKIKVPSETIRMAICITVIGPIVFAYPFFQKYFIKGLMVGAIKG